MPTQGSVRLRGLHPGLFSMLPPGARASDDLYGLHPGLFSMLPPGAKTLGYAKQESTRYGEEISVPVQNRCTP